MIEINWTSYATKTLLDLDFSDFKRLVLAVSQLRSFLQIDVNEFSCVAGGAMRKIVVEGFELRLRTSECVVEICEVRVKRFKERAR